MYGKDPILTALAQKQYCLVIRRKKEVLACLLHWHCENYWKDEWERRVFVRVMPGHTCIVCRNTPSKDPSVSFHSFPGASDSKSALWLKLFGLNESRLRLQSRVCSKHFLGGDTTIEPMLTLGKRFASPIKQQHLRAKRAKARETGKALADLRTSMSQPRLLSALVSQLHLARIQHWLHQ